MWTRQAGCLHPERPGFESGPRRQLQPPLIPLSSYMAATVCVCKACVYKHMTSESLCVCVFRGWRGSLRRDATRPSFIPDWDEGSGVGFVLQCAAHKDRETTFPPHFPHEYQRRRQRHHHTGRAQGKITALLFYLHYL